MVAVCSYKCFGNRWRNGVCCCDAEDYLQSNRNNEKEETNRMKVLMINKFLYPNGGSETYIFKLGEHLEKMGHEVQYFGMEHKGRCVGNRVNCFAWDAKCDCELVMEKVF